LNVCIQVALVPEDAKGGVPPAGLPELAARIAELPRLALRGLMCIPPPLDARGTSQRALFEQLARLHKNLNASGLALDTLSMGMSDDFEEAIGAGATMVRIGSAIFGPR
jgi:pyridoxal phosphate enzyme (YggS family)